MAPTAIAPFQPILALFESGIKQTAVIPAPFVTTSANSTPSPNGLDALEIVFIRNTSPHAVPESDSQQVWTQSVCADDMVICQ